MKYNFKALHDRAVNGGSLTPEERQYVIKETLWASESAEKQQLEALSDLDLARECWLAMSTWVSNNTLYH